MITIDRIKEIATDIVSDNEWVNDSHSKAEHRGVKDGLNRLINHLEIVEIHDRPKNYTEIQIRLREILINYGCEENGDCILDEICDLFNHPLTPEE